MSCPILHSYNIFFSLLFYRNGPSSHYSGSSSRGQGSSALNSSWKSEAPLSPKPGSASNPNLGSSAADILSVKSSSLYLNNDDRRNAASPVSTSSSTSSKFNLIYQVTRKYPLRGYVLAHLEGLWDLTTQGVKFFHIQNEMIC